MRVVTVTRGAWTIPLVLACRLYGTEVQPAAMPSPAAVAAVILAARHDSTATFIVDSTQLAKTTGWRRAEIATLRELLRGRVSIGVPASSAACAGELATRCVVVSVLSYAGTREAATIEVRWSPLKGCGSQAGTYEVSITGNRAAIDRQIAGAAGDCGPRGSQSD